MNEKMFIEAYRTDDYASFKFAIWNRKIDFRKVNKIVGSISQYGYIGTPIIVNEKKYIIDGQHRFLACKQLGIPFVYSIRPGYGFDEAMALNQCQNNWTLRDFINAYAREEYKGYQRLEKLLTDYKMALNITTCAVFGKAIKNRSITDGMLEIDDEQYSEAQELLSYAKTYDVMDALFGSRKDMVYCCIIKLAKNNLIDKERMHHQFAKYGNTFQSAPNELETIQSLNDLYNVGNRKKEYFVDAYRSTRQ